MQLDLAPQLQAAILGVVEGLTEFLPISSTGHLILAGHFLGFESEGRVFEVAIQLGAILAVCLLYVRRLLNLALALPSRPEARRFVLALFMGFLPAAFFGALLHDRIKALFEHPIVVPVMLVIGGVIILLIERRHPAPEVHQAEAIHPLRGLLIGCCQALAMVPGVSRSGATIMGGMLLGVDRKAAAEFSFFLAIPTMLAATVFDLWQNRELLGGGDLQLIAIGFVCAFVAAAIVVKALLAFLSRNTFRVFGWYRIVFGILMFAILYAGG